MGGGVYAAYDDAMFVSCLIAGNVSYLGGGVYINSSDVQLLNCTITQNQSTSTNQFYHGGGGVYVESDSPTIIGSIVYGNTAALPGGSDLYIYVSTPPSPSNYPWVFLDHNCISRTPETVATDYSRVIWYPGNVDPPPLFNGYQLAEGSPCINAAIANSSQAFQQDANSKYYRMDAAGSPRIQACRADIGAFESSFMVDLNNNTQSDACEVTSNPPMALDCNDNLAPDDVDILTGASPDGNDNNIPDECEPCGNADFDLDGDADQEDFSRLQRCVHYIEGGAESEMLGDCRAMFDELDLNGDQTLNQLDLTEFLACVNGPAMPPVGITPSTPNPAPPPDTDGDGVPNASDNCPFEANAQQEDADSDGVGDACDACPGYDDTLDMDADGVPDDCDSEPLERGLAVDQRDDDGTGPSLRRELADDDVAVADVGIHHGLPADLEGETSTVGA